MLNNRTKKTIELLKEYGSIDTNNLSNDDINLLELFNEYIIINSDLIQDSNSDDNFKSYYLDQLTDMIEYSNSDLKYLVYKYWEWI